MSDEQFRYYIETIRQRTALQGEQITGAWQESVAALEGLQLIYEEMQTSLEVAEVVEEELLEQNQRVTADYHHYYELFHSSPLAYLVTDAKGLILEANQAIARLLNLPKRYLIGKPLFVFMAQSDRLAFRTLVNQLSQTNDVQQWQVKLSPLKREPFLAQLHLGITRNNSGFIETLQIGVYNMSQSQQPNPQEIPSAGTMPVPHSLDGLQVLVVDDEADVREFITAVLESHGIGVRAVASAAAALEELERFYPDVLLSDIRMPNGDGYSLIQQIRAWEAEQGKHIPAAAITAYLEEDREKSITSGFEAHLHKLAQPSEWVKMVDQLARQTSNLERDLLS